ncbi:hypothetical protein RND71_016264 [Anisodus tanguticus]|uniref:RNA-dependent RNA polymerase n=1 Tax=Anisodus tanguticus TaxID=243964 RepID=A0AAE1S7U6_9SOLA|nr:hypothetical protein RND71_016264 [Anisodus tanguticus]
MESEVSAKDLVLTQISVGGFDNDVNAKMLSEYLEEQFGQVWRCRLKTSSTPPDSYPTYDIDVERSTKYALAASRRNEILLEEKPLKVSLGPENPFRLNEGRRTIIPCKFTDVSVEIGVLVGKDDFVVGWRGPHTRVNFLVDPFNGTCKIFFTKNIVFSLNGETRHAIIKCNFKIEVLLRGIDEIKEYKDFTSLVILLQLASSPLVFYRTADDDIEESVAFDLLDNDDQWIRTTDITCSGAIGRVPKVERCNGKCLRVRDEPDFGVSMAEPFFCFQKHEGLVSEVSTHPEMAVEVRRRVEVLPSEIPDIERNGYVFSDRIGMMSADLATKVAEKLQLSANPPCAYQKDMMVVKVLSLVGRQRMMVSVFL